MNKGLLERQAYLPRYTYLVPRYEQGLSVSVSIQADSMSADVDRYLPWKTPMKLGN